MNEIRISYILYNHYILYEMYAGVLGGSDTPFGSSKYGHSPFFYYYYIFFFLLACQRGIGHVRGCPVYGKLTRHFLRKKNKKCRCIKLWYSVVIIKTFVLLAFYWSIRTLSYNADIKVQSKSSPFNVNAYKVKKSKLLNMSKMYPLFTRL